MHMRFTYLLVSYFLLFIILLIGCDNKKSVDNDVVPPKVTVRSADLKVDTRLVSATNGFAFRIYQKLFETDNLKNLFISPASIEFALAMTYNGAGGTTKDGMSNTLGFTDMTLNDVNSANMQLMTLLDNPDPNVELAIANSLWGKSGTEFNADFMQRCKTFYKANISTVDFTLKQTADDINSWVSENTRGKIDKLVESANIKDSLLLLINALYFKGEWTDKFDINNTANDQFTLSDGTGKTVPMMQRTANNFEYLSTDQFQAIRLPYGDKDNKFVYMYIFLPKDGTTLKAFAEGLTLSKWNSWVTQFGNHNGTLYLPRFKANYSTSLKSTLSALGMTDAFSTQADFSGLLPADTVITEKPYISDVIHKTVLDVNEEGTVAAAVTGVIVGTTSLPPPPFEMKVNHPFFITIADRPTGAILFMGSIANPE